MKKQKRRTRSDKFPLTLHPTGQYCKKINGKIYYFGTNKKQALRRYLDQATYLHGYPCAKQADPGRFSKGADLGMVAFIAWQRPRVTIASLEYGLQRGVQESQR